MQGGSEPERGLRAGGAQGPADPAGAIESLERIVHELNGLLDGSLRTVSLLARSLAQPDRAQSDDRRALAGLRTVRTALERMSAVVAGAARVHPGGRTLVPESARGGRRVRAPGVGVGLIDGRDTPAGDEAASALDALRGAAAVLEGWLTVRGAAVRVVGGAWADRLEAGPAYAVALAGLRNAVEAALGSGRAGASVELCARGEPAEAPERLVVEVIDSGPGLAPGMGAGGALIPRRTTKPGHLGIGLALCAQEVERWGGALELLDRAAAGDAQSGAVLRAVVPVRGAA
ncbi:MAG: hypothetical protein C0513_08610 [Isosphaera sp.]|nr:hypothetical protein [Isosphaera sp.]